jgi:hypothetical protein
MSVSATIGPVLVRAKQSCVGPILVLSGYDPVCVGPVLVCFGPDPASDLSPRPRRPRSDVRPVLVNVGHDAALDLYWRSRSEAAMMGPSVDEAMDGQDEAMGGLGGHDEAMVDEAGGGHNGAIGG